MTLTRTCTRNPSRSEWAVTTHLAGKIRSGDRSHRTWAELHAPEADYTVSSVPALANQLLVVVGEQMRISRVTGDAMGVDRR